MQQLSFHCTLQESNFTNHGEYKKFDIYSVNQDFELNILSQISSKWSKYFNADKQTLHFYQFNACPGYAKRELEVTANGSWSVYSEGKKRDISFEWSNIPTTLKCYSDIMELLDTIGNMKTCQGCNFDKYKSLIHKHDASEQQPIFRSKDGSPAAVVDIMQSKNKEKVIRSTKCLIFLVNSNVIKTPNICEACRSTDHYLRRML